MILSLIESSKSKRKNFNKKRNKKRVKHKEKNKKLKSNTKNTKNKKKLIDQIKELYKCLKECKVTFEKQVKFLKEYQKTSEHLKQLV
jgi:dsDNA-specific endonuclease/ATPase MutS2